MLAIVVLALLAAPAFGRSAIKIIGGEDAEVGQFPFQGSLRVDREDGTRSHTCGCALITSRYCVSAAHCTQNPASSYDVRLGITKRSETDDGQTIAVSQIFNHPSYGSGPGSYPNDISVILLAEEADLNSELIATIEMASTGENFDGQTGIISGWGLTETGGVGDLPDHLQFVEVTVFSQDECVNHWGSSINDGHVCVGVLNSAGACNGDSGGPLAVDGVLVGVTSWGIGGCFPIRPSVYTNIEFFRDWVDSIIA